MLGKSDAMSPKNSVVDSWNRLLVSAKCKAVQMLWNLSEQPTKMLAFCFPSKTTSYRTNGTTDVLYEGLLWRSSCRGWIWDGRCPWWWCLQCSSPQTANRSKQENRSYLEMNANDFQPKHTHTHTNPPTLWCKGSVVSVFPKNKFTFRCLINSHYTLLLSLFFTGLKWSANTHIKGEVYFLHIKPCNKDIYSSTALLWQSHGAVLRAGAHSWYINWLKMAENNGGACALSRSVQKHNKCSF